MRGENRTRYVRRPLTPTQIEYLRLVMRGLENKEIAHLRGVRMEAVKDALEAIYLRLDVPNRTAAVVVALRLGILDLHADG